MSKARWKQKVPPYVKLEHRMLDSPAWLALTPQQRSVYVQLHRRYNGSNNGSIGFSVRLASAECNINKETAAKCLKQLEELGFIECVTPGGFSRKTRHAAEWRLTAYPTGSKAGDLAFMKWGRAEKEARSKPSGMVEVYVSGERTTQTASKAA